MPNLITLFFVPWGNASRKEYAIGLFGSQILSFIIIAMIGAFIVDTDESIGWFIGLLIRIMMTYVGINLMVKRLHDLWESGWKIFFMIIPFFNIYYFFRLLFEQWIDHPQEQSTSPDTQKNIPVIEQQMSIATKDRTTSVSRQQATTAAQAQREGINLQSNTDSTSPIKRIILGIIGVVIIWGGMFWGVANIVKSSGAYELSIHELETNPMITDIYGKFDVWFMPMGSIQTSWLDGEASIQIAIEGEKTKWEIYVDLIKEYGEWKMLEMVSVDENNRRQFIIGQDKTTTGTNIDQ